MIVWEMFSRHIPFENLRWTAEICTQLEQGHSPAFESAWHAPPMIQELVAQCCHVRPSARPSFVEVRTLLFQAAESIPALHDFVMSKWKEHDDMRSSGNELSARVQLLDQNMKKLQEEKVQATAQIKALQERLGHIDAQMADIETIRQRLVPSSSSDKRS